MIDQCYFSTHLAATWTGNHRNTSVIFSYNPRISLSLSTLTLVHVNYVHIYTLVVMLLETQEGKNQLGKYSHCTSVIVYIN